jgi:hypothetical protein
LEQMAYQIGVSLAAEFSAGKSKVLSLLEYRSSVADVAPKKD